jgi:hypothetical protein
MDDQLIQPDGRWKNIFIEIKSDKNGKVKIFWQ